MDSRTLGAAAGVQVGTINAWIQRGWVLGTSVEVSGRRRDFDINTASHIAIMAELMQFGFGAPLASWVATLVLTAFDQGSPRCVIMSSIQEGRENPAAGADVQGLQLADGSWIPSDVVDIYKAAYARMPHILSDIGQKSGLIMQYLDSDKNVSDVLADVPADRMPGVFLIIDMDRVVAKMQRVEKAWQQQRRKTRSRRANS
jgi:hypothetical protein